MLPAIGARVPKMVRLIYFVVSLISVIVKAQSAIENQTDAGHGLQVVNLVHGANGTSEYKLELQALKGLLTREDVVDRPVVLVSIAGPFRGGKSFLLNFFLRYLSAPASSQKNGTWLGNSNESLKGFHWRGGSERETTGIHMWSEPFHVKLDSTGEEVVVLLMDTQGTFDSKSSLRDSTTIFALSTLLSSVQLYNLFRNIHENDLHNLHLFTDYGAKAGNNTKVFQDLHFLIRDWPNPYEYSYGYSGGNQFLTEKLKVEDDQTPELRIVREHIRSSFRNVSCFLMPHPGLKVASKKFDGSLADIEEDFKTSLLELVSSLFDPSHISPKEIGGHQLTGRDMLVFFEKYVEVFNSEALPPITSILDGVSAAAIMAAVGAARDLYKKRMGALESDNRSYSPATVRALHHAARTEALQYFNSRKLLGSKENSDDALNQLLKDMDQYLGSYQYNNEIKIKLGHEAAVHVYEETLRSSCGVKSKELLCLHPVDLEQCHKTVRSAALLQFDSLRKMEGNETDDEKVKLEKKFMEDLKQLKVYNVENNNRAVAQGCSLYRNLMSKVKTSLPDALRRQHQLSVGMAKSFLRGVRSMQTKQPDDPYMEQIIQTIDGYYKKTVEKQYKIAMDKGKDAFRQYLASEWGPSDYSNFSPQSLKELYNVAKSVAFNVFDSIVLGPDGWTYKSQLLEDLESEYTDMKQRNKNNNWRAVNEAYDYYTSRMDQVGRFLNFGLDDVHYNKKQEAVEAFLRRRLRKYSWYYCDDYYCESLKNKIDRVYDDEYATFWSRVG